MAKHHLRKDTTCENCAHTVEERFCTHCGQENVETRQTFGHLVRHFMEDLTHYESNVWKTVKYLLFRPAYLTKCYLSGKRVTYVPPVKLYIFISFIAFFLPGILPDFNEDHNTASETNITINKRTTEPKEKITYSTKPTSFDTSGNINVLGTSPSQIKTETEYDSLQNALPMEKREGFIARWMSKRTIHFQSLPEEERNEKFKEQLLHNFPKVLFFYLPIFAFFLWLFHSKKKWFYFDHAIFTLHFFSFLLLLVTIFTLIHNLIPWHLFMDASIIRETLAIIGGLWILQYFYRGHHKLYEEKFWINWLKSTLVLSIGTFVFLLLLTCFVMLTIFTIH